MQKEYISYDGEKISYKRWLAEKEMCIVQIAHGLGEMSDYYEEFARIANEHHISVYLNEARGHGKTQAIYNQENIIDQMVHDLSELNKLIRKSGGHSPIFLLGHSLGSVLGQLAAVRYEKAWQGLILTGIPHHQNVKELLNEIHKEIERVGLQAPSETIEANLLHRSMIILTKKKEYWHG